uniref:alpha-1,6-mannosyl-glycoprotein 6-beta-N-acetylglucosaminyltransferase n=1 Tax=Periophthalmus magnuspinnatus TaxID=409849 RepID=A0A3B3ZPI5_9GOBI
FKDKISCYLSSEPTENCKVPLDPTFPLCADKMEVRYRKSTDPCYAFYGVDGSTCSLLKYLSQTEDFCPPQAGLNHTAPAWHQTPLIYCSQAEIRTSLAPLSESIRNSSSPGLKFIRSRVQRMEQRWIRAGLNLSRRSNITVSRKLRVQGGYCYFYVLGQRFEAMVERGGPLGELVQWADLSASLTVLGHNVTLTTSQHLLHSLIGAAPGRGSCPIQRPLTFDLIYTDYHGLAHLQGAMGIAFRHYQCRYRILDSFGTEPAFNLGSYARSREDKTLWGSWDLHPQQYMTMFRNLQAPRNPIPVTQLCHKPRPVESGQLCTTSPQRQGVILVIQSDIRHQAIICKSIFLFRFL